MQGVWIGLAVIVFWALALIGNLALDIDWSSPWTYLRIWVQMHLFTGLFITAHDAMHGTVAPGRPVLNRRIGTLAAFLFVFNDYRKLLPKHHEHHRHVASEDDPDYHTGNPAFLRWFWDFVTEYITFWQILAAAIFYNVLIYLGVAELHLIIYWIIPSILSMLQLFVFGTYLPHRGEHDNAHHARSQQSHPIGAFLTCYFFGYHFEHHDKPGIPWWKLWREREIKTAP